MRAIHRDTSTGKIITRSGALSVDCCGCGCTCSTTAGCVSTVDSELHFSAKCNHFAITYKDGPASASCCCGPCEGRRIRGFSFMRTRNFLDADTCESWERYEIVGDPYVVDGICKIDMHHTARNQGPDGASCSSVTTVDETVTVDLSCPALYFEFGATCNGTGGGIEYTSSVSHADCARREKHEFTKDAVVGDHFNYIIEFTSLFECDNNDAGCHGAGTGACCYADHCENCATEAECESSGGTYAGDGVVCYDADCFHRHRCCTPGGGCFDTTESDCEALGGSWNSSETCDSAPCPGACCKPDGCESMTADECLAAGGYFFPDTDCASIADRCKFYFQTRLCPCVDGTVTMPLVDPDCWGTVSEGGLYCPVWTVPTHEGGTACVEADPSLPMILAGPDSVILCGGASKWGCCGCCPGCTGDPFTVYRIDYHLGVATRTDGEETKCCCDPDTASTHYVESVKTYFLVDGVLKLFTDIEIDSTVSAGSTTITITTTDYSFGDPIVTTTTTTRDACASPLATINDMAGIQEGTLVASCNKLTISGYSDNTGTGGARIEFIGAITRTVPGSNCTGVCEGNTSGGLGDPPAPIMAMKAPAAMTPSRGCGGDCGGSVANDGMTI